MYHLLYLMYITLNLLNFKIFFITKKKKNIKLVILKIYFNLLKKRKETLVQQLNYYVTAANRLALECGAICSLFWGDGKVTCVPTLTN